MTKNNRIISKEDLLLEFKNVELNAQLLRLAVENATDIRFMHSTPLPSDYPVYPDSAEVNPKGADMRRPGEPYSFHMFLANREHVGELRKFIDELQFENCRLEICPRARPSIILLGELESKAFTQILLAFIAKENGLSSTFEERSNEASRPTSIQSDRKNATVEPSGMK